MAEDIRRIAVFGAGGHGKVVVDAILRIPGLVPACVVDDDPRFVGSHILGHQVVGGREALLAVRDTLDGIIVAIGNNRVRRELGRWLDSQSLRRVSVIHPAAVVASSAQIGRGSLIMPGAIVNADARIGEDVIINTGAIVEHDCQVGAGVHVAPGSVLCGGVEVGEETLVGAGSVVIQGLKIGPHLLVKAGTTIVRNMESAT